MMVAQRSSVQVVPFESISGAQVAREGLRKPRLPLADRVPEEVHYPDTGCAVSPSCLQCPLPRCVYDETPESRAAAQRERDEAIFRRYQEGRARGRRGTDIQDLADSFGVSRRTVHRAIQRLKCERGS